MTTIAGHWCRQCHRNTRKLADGRRCPECHPLAGTDPWRPPDWCGECDQHTRQRETVAGIIKCHRCHPMAHPPQRWPISLVPQSWADQLAACEWLCYISPTLRRIGGDDLREQLRKFFDHGWTPNDVLFALDKQPTGELHTGETPTAAHERGIVTKWLIKRLRLWEDSTGAPLPSLYAHIDAARDNRLARQQQARQQYAAQAARAVPASASAAAAHAKQIAAEAGIRSRAGKPFFARRERVAVLRSNVPAARAALDALMEAR